MKQWTRVKNIDNHRPRKCHLWQKEQQCQRMTQSRDILLQLQLWWCSRTWSFSSRNFSPMSAPKLKFHQAPSLKVVMHRMTASEFNSEYFYIQCIYEYYKKNQCHGNIICLCFVSDLDDAIMEQISNPGNGSVSMLVI